MGGGEEIKDDSVVSDLLTRWRMVGSGMVKDGEKQFGLGRGEVLPLRYLSDVSEIGTVGYQARCSGDF